MSSTTYDFLYDFLSDKSSFSSAMANAHPRNDSTVAINFSNKSIIKYFHLAQIISGNQSKLSANA